MTTRCHFFAFPMRRKSLVAATFFSLLFASAAAFARWQPIGAGKGKIAIDAARMAYISDGYVAVWSRIELAQVAEDGEGRYNAVEALNRYDCVRRRFTTLKRLYLMDETLVRAESVLTPKEMEISATGLEAGIVAEVCKGSAPADTAKSVPGMDQAAEPHIMTVSASTSAAAPAAQPPHRFIILPHIDPSMIEHPTDEPPPGAAKTEKAAPKTPAELARAAKSEAEKAGVRLDTMKGMDRHAREIALATSGPLRAKAHVDNPVQEIRWSYAGEGAPARWAKLNSDYVTCERGQRQSPVDLRDGIRVDMEPIVFDYKPGSFRIVDTGNTVQITPSEGSTMSVMGRNYRLTQIRFHHPGEERIAGRGYEMSMQLEHRDEQGHIAIVSVMIERGEAQSTIQTFWNNLPLETNSELAVTASIDIAELLPPQRDYYAYMGSLTTPPCSEGVLWLVMKQPLQLSDEQIAIFARLYPNNARPLQAMNGRLIKESR